MVLTGPFGKIVTDVVMLKICQKRQNTNLRNIFAEINLKGLEPKPQKFLRRTTYSMKVVTDHKFARK